MDASLIAWVLNLDAELELERGPGTPSGRVRQAIARALPAARAAVMSEGDRLVGEDAIPAGLRGRCWCPTPSALERLRGAGATPEPAPSLQVLRHVNGRAFCAGLGPTLEGARFAASADAVRLGQGPWRLKRAYGFAGRGQRRVRAPLSEEDERWIEASFPHGLQVEPDVALVREVSTHGMVGSDGRVNLATPMEQQCKRGAWLSSRPPATPVPDAVVLEAARVGAALAAASYFGPFGVDAFEYTWNEARRWNLRSEINARYTMGYVHPPSPSDR